MGQRIAIVSELKRVLKERGLTYADVARRLRLSHASVKRLFSTADFSLERIDAICELAGLEVSELIEGMRERKSPVTTLTLAQEREIVADPRLFLMTWLVLNRWPFEDIVKAYKFSEREALRYLIKLDRLQIIELQPGNRTRLRITGNVSWHQGGPMQRYLHQKLLKEFFESDFADPRAEFCFYGAVMSDEVVAQIKHALQNIARECMELSERDTRLPLSQRNGTAYVLALRPWQFSGFDVLRR